MLHTRTYTYLLEPKKGRSVEMDVYAKQKYIRQINDGSSGVVA